MPTRTQAARNTKLRAAVSARLASTAGETLMEVLVALLIIVAVIAMLCTTIVTAAKVNNSIPPGDVVFNALAEPSDPGEPEVPEGKGSLTLIIDHYELLNASDGSATVELKTQNGYWWYELE